MALQLQSFRYQRLSDRCTTTKQNDEVDGDRPQSDFKASPLESLSTELLLCLADFLPRSSLHCVANTCRRLRGIFGGHVVRHWDNFDGIYKLFLALRRDMYCSPCLDHHDCPLPAGPYLFCSGCGAYHVKALFSEAQVNVRDASRICIGRQGHIRVCGHKTFTFSELQEATLRHRQSVETHNCNVGHVSIFRCQDLDHRHGFGNKNAQTIPEVTLFYNPYKILIQWEESISICSRVEEATERELKLLLEERRRQGRLYICPHVQLDDLRVAAEFSSAKSTRSDFDQWAKGLRFPYWKIVRDDSNSPCGLPTKSHCTHCSALYSVYRWRWNLPLRWFSGLGFSDLINLSVIRSINITDPASYEWLQNLEQGSYQFSDASKHVVWCDSPGCFRGTPESSTWNTCMFTSSKLTLAEFT